MALLEGLCLWTFHIFIFPGTVRPTMKHLSREVCAPKQRLARCLGEYRGHVDVVLVATEDLVPMRLSIAHGWVPEVALDKKEASVFEGGAKFTAKQ